MKETADERAVRWFYRGMTLEERIAYLWERVEGLQRENEALKKVVRDLTSGGDVV